MGEWQQDIEATLMPNQQILLAAKAAQVGDLAQARSFCEEVLARDPQHGDALLWLTVSTDSMAAKVRLLQKAVSANPADDRAKTLLNWTQSRQLCGETISTSMEIGLLTPCPYLGAMGNHHARFTYPCAGNLCHAEASKRHPPRALSDETQRDICLTTDHLACPTYGRATATSRQQGPDVTHLHGYFDYFGLDEEPFNIVPTPRFFYPTRQHEEALALLHQVIEHHQGLSLLTAPVGLGKTLILRVLHEEFFWDPHYTVAFLPHSHWGTEYAMMQAIFRALGVVPPKRRSLRDLGASFEEFVKQQVFQAHKTVVILFDEAQTMSPDILYHVRQILDFQIDGQQMVQVVLAGTPGLLERVNRLPALKDRVIASYALSPLTPSEVKSFISARMHEAGSQDGLFTPAAVRMITDLTRGSPRRINVVCTRCLFEAFRRHVHSIDQDLVLRIVDHPPVEGAAPPVAADPSPAGQSFFGRLRFLLQGEAHS